MKGTRAPPETHAGEGRCVMYGAHPAHVGGAGLDVAARAADDRAPSGNDGACTRHNHTAPERYLACDRA